MERSMRFKRIVTVSAIAVTLLFGVAVSLCGCSTVEVAEAESDVTPMSSRFTIQRVDVDDGSWDRLYIITDTETGCQYLCWSSPYSLFDSDDGTCSGMELLVDKYGYPALAPGYTRNGPIEGPSDDEGI